MKKIRTLISVFIYSIVLLSLSACGFHLRGAEELPPALHTVYLQADDPYGSFTKMLVTLLRSSAITLVDTPSEAPILLQVSAPKISISGSTVGNSSEARVYGVNCIVRFSLLSARGKTLLPPQTLRADAVLTLNANQLIESNNQLEQTVRELQRDIINQLFNRLISKQVFQILAPITPPHENQL